MQHILRTDKEQCANVRQCAPMWISATFERNGAEGAPMRANAPHGVWGTGLRGIGAFNAQCAPQVTLSEMSKHLALAQTQSGLAPTRRRNGLYGFSREYTYE